MQPSITGYGLVTPLGTDALTTWQSLLDGRSISSHTRLDEHLGNNGGRVISFAQRATAEAIQRAGWTDCSNVAVIACTSKGSIEDWMCPNPFVSGVGAVFDAITAAEAGANGIAEYVFGLADLSSAIARFVGATDGPRLTLSAACASGLHGLIRGAMMIQSGEAKRVLVVAAEASVHPMFLASFARLGVLPKQGEVCRPFDQRRSGFLMSEAAAAVCLEAEPSARGIVTIDRYAMAGDATHLTASDPQGRVLRRMLQQVIGDHPVDLIHAHGTGTVSNDLTELDAIEATLKLVDGPGPQAGDRAADRALRQSTPGLSAQANTENQTRPAPSRSPDSRDTGLRPMLIAPTNRRVSTSQPNSTGQGPVSQYSVETELTCAILFSHKGALGHSLGASGLVSVVLNCLAHRHGLVPGHPNTNQPLDAVGVLISQSSIERPIQRSIVHAAGFGGPSAVVGLRSAD
jgi:3-oxoacyl-[acyl-carrier-protein] synthase II